jgi:predicted GIY-YIG superfamily endonuclease
MYYVYLLVTTSKNNSYVGATVNLERRLRQHNKELKGGAVATSIQVNSGEKWERICYISGFPDWSAALQFEWKWKQLTRQLSFNRPPLDRRLDALKKLLSLERSTSKAIPFSEWSVNPEIHFEDDYAKSYYETKYK